MEMTKDLLNENFDKARDNESPFVFVSIVAEGTAEVIAIPEESFDAKEQFYDRVYNDDLVHVMNSKVYIQAVTHGHAEELNNLI